MSSKILTLAATALFVVMSAAAPAAAQSTTFPGLAGPAPSTGQTLTHANGYSVSVPTDWVVAADVNGADFMMGNPDLSVVCSVFSAANVGLNATDEQLRAALGSQDFGPDLFTNLLFKDVPDLKFESTGPQADHPGGWPVQRAVATLPIEGVAHTAYAYLTFKADSAFAGFCFTETGKAAAGKTSIDGVINSLKIHK